MVQPEMLEMLDSHAGAPWGETGDPSWNVGRVGLVFLAEGFAERGLFVEDDEEMRGEPREDRVDEKVLVAEKESLAENERRDCNVHGVSDEAIRALNDEVLRGKDWSGRADSLKGEAREGFEDDCCSSSHE